MKSENHFSLKFFYIKFIEIENRVILHEFLKHNYSSYISILCARH